MASNRTLNGRRIGAATLVAVLSTCLALVATPAGAQTGTVVASDNFNRPDEVPFGIGGNWARVVAGNFDGVSSLIGNQVSAVANEGIYYWQGPGTFDNARQFARQRVVQNDGEVGLVLLGGPDQAIMVAWGPPGIGTSVYIYWYSGGLDSGVLAIGSSTLNDGDIIEAALDGGVIYAKVNGVTVQSVANTTTLTSGKPGFITYLNPNKPEYVGILDDWQGGTPQGLQPACDDGADNDGDGLVDLADPGCANAADPSEQNSSVACDDGADNDGDALVDSADPGCANATDASEQNSLVACDDGADNDGDVLVDSADPGCANATDASEQNSLVECDDGVDNDADSLVDLTDPGCAGPADPSELNGAMYAISGTITENAAGLSGVLVTASGGFSGSATTNGSGVYSIASVPSGATSIVLTPTLSGHVMNPLTRSVAGPVTANTTNEDFSSTLSTTAVLTTLATHGSVARNPDQPTYTLGTQVTLTPVPDSGFSFANWSGDVPVGHEADNPLTVTMDQNRTITAGFTTPGLIASDNFNRANETPLAVGGNWQSSIGGASANLTGNQISGATGDALYHWQGAGTFANTRQYARAKVVQATGQVGIVLLGASGQGLVTAWNGGTLYIYWYASGSYQGNLSTTTSFLQNGDIIEAQLDDGRIYAKVNGIVVASAANTTTLTSGRPGFETFLAGGVLDDWDAGTPQSAVLTTLATHGSVTRNPDQTEYALGTEVLLTPISDSGFTFANWSGAVPIGHEADNPLTVTMNQGRTITARFTSPNVIASDNFNRADETPLVVGGVWQRSFSGATANLAGQHVSGATGDALYYWQGAGTFQDAQQYARARVVQATGQVGLVLLGGSGQGLVAAWKSGTLYIYWYIGGGYQGNLTTLSSSLQNGDVIEAQLAGGTIYAKINGTVVASVLNTIPLASGRPGFETFLTGGTLDDWEAGTSHVACDDGADNDGDGYVDLADPGCASASDVSEQNLSVACDDGADNDGDGFVDLADPGCASASDASEQNGSVACDDGADNDGDGYVDLADLGCASASDVSEQNSSLVCDDGADNDGDGYVDLADPGCASASDASEQNSSVACDDGADNDGDGFVDLADPGCASASDASEQNGSVACDDGADNDGDSLVDLADPGCTSASDASEQNGSVACDDGADNDGDGLVDLADPGCTSVTDDDEESQPAPIPMLPPLGRGVLLVALLAAAAGAAAHRRALDR